MRLLLISALILGAGCGGQAAAAPATQVGVSLTDTAIQLDQASAPAGTVTFKLKNAGTVLHSVMLLKTDVPHDKLVADPKDPARVDRTGIVRESAQIQVGGSVEFSAKLASGNYVLVCNEPGHYLIGMHAPFTVR